MEKISVLASGGLDSSVLIAKLADGAEVYPIYVRCGFAWEDIELAGLSDRIHGTKHVQSGTLYLRGRDKGGRFTYGWPPEDEKPHEQKRDQGGGRNREEFGD